MLGGVGLGLSLEQGIDPGEDPGVRPAGRLPLADQLQLRWFEVAEERQHLDHLQRVVVVDRELAALRPPGRRRPPTRRLLDDAGSRRNLAFTAGRRGRGWPRLALHDREDKHDSRQGRTGDRDEDQSQRVREEEPRQQEDRGDDDQEEAHEEHEHTALDMAMTTEDGSGGLYPGVWTTGARPRATHDDGSSLRTDPNRPAPRRAPPTPRSAGRL